MQIKGNVEIVNYNPVNPHIINGCMTLDMPCVYAPSPLSGDILVRNNVSGTVGIHPNSFILNRLAEEISNSQSDLNMLVVDKGVIKSIPVKKDVLDVHDVEFRKQHPQAEEAWQNVLNAIEEYIMVKKLVG